MNSNSSIVIPNQIGTVAAILTSIEFFIGTLAAISLGPALYGLWLLKLHIKGKISMKKSDLKYRILRREAIALFIAMCFAISVALVEDSLDEDVRVMNREVQAVNCARTDVLYDFHSVNVLRPPYHYSIDDSAINIAKQIGCKQTGLLTIQFGGFNGNVLSDSNASLFAPKCRNETGEANPFFPNLDDGISFSWLALIEYNVIGFQLDDPTVSIFPYWDAETVGKTRKREKDHAEEYEPIESCLKLNISSFPMRYFKKWETSVADDYNVSRIILNRLCSNINGALPQLMAYQKAFDCYSHGYFFYIDCLFESANSTEIASVDLKSVGIYITEDSKDEEKILFDEGVQWAARGVACPNVDIRIGYLLIGTNTLRDYLNESYFNKNVPKDQAIFIPYKFEVLSGRCESTIPVLGFSAMLYSATANWTNNSLANMDKHILYHSYMLSMAKSFFPFPEFRRQRIVNESLNITSYPCFLRDVGPVTIIRKNWRFAILVTVSIISVLCLILATVFFFLFPRAAWKISPLETLQRFNPLHKSFEKEEEYIIESTPLKPKFQNTHQSNKSPEEGIGSNPEISIELIKTSTGGARSPMGRGIKYKITSIQSK